MFLVHTGVEYFVFGFFLWMGCIKKPSLVFPCVRSHVCVRSRSRVRVHVCRGVGIIIGIESEGEVE
jgi:hypothetical protein